MTARAGWGRVLSVGALTLALYSAAAVAAGWLSEAHGQWENRSSTNPAIIAARLRLALAHQEEALRYLAAPPSIETLDAAAKSIYAAYAQVRLAHAGILARISKTEKFKDPLLEWQEGRIQSARNGLLAAMDQAKNAKRLRELRRIGKSIELLQSSMILVRQVLEVMS